MFCKWLEESFCHCPLFSRNAIVWLHRGSKCGLSLLYPVMSSCSNRFAGSAFKFQVGGLTDHLRLDDSCCSKPTSYVSTSDADIVRLDASSVNWSTGIFHVLNLQILVLLNFAIVQHKALRASSQATRQRSCSLALWPAQPAREGNILLLKLEPPGTYHWQFIHPVRPHLQQSIPFKL